MPRRLYKRRRELISHKAIAEMREAIRQGYPWLHEPVGADLTGLMDLHALVDGTHFESLCDFWTDPADEDTPKFLWQHLGEALTAEHAARRPGTRPQAWWRFQAPEPRRFLDIDLRYTGEQERPGFDELQKKIKGAIDQQSLEAVGIHDIYLGACHISKLLVYEHQREYLTRHDMLTDGEKSIFQKFDDVEFVRVSLGTFGQCAPCWEEAKRMSAEIDFGLERAVIPYNVFWVPAVLVNDCDHMQFGSVGGIFTVDHWG